MQDLTTPIPPVMTVEPERFDVLIQKVKVIIKISVGAAGSRSHEAIKPVLSILKVK
jgi:hypothetical protein